MNTSLGAGDPDLNPEGIQAVLANEIPEIFRRCTAMIAERRERPTDDLTACSSTPRSTARSSRSTRS